MSEENASSMGRGPLEGEIWLKGYLQGYYAALNHLVSNYQKIQEDVSRDMSSRYVADEEPSSNGTAGVLSIAEPDAPDNIGPPGPGESSMSEEETALINAKLRELVE